MTRATASQFEEWKQACIADPSKLDALPASQKELYLKLFGINPIASKPRVTAESHGLQVTLVLHEEATFDEIALFAYRVTSMMSSIPKKDFAELLKTATDALAHIGATWDDVFIYLKASA